MSTTQTTDQIANQANDKLAKNIADLGKVLDGLKTASTVHEDLTYKIKEKEQQLAGLDTQFKETERRKAVELELKQKENEATLLATIMAKQGKTVIATDELEELRDEVLDLTSNFETKLTEAVGKVKQEEAARANAIVKQKELELQVKEAGNAAAITSLTEKNQLLASQVTDYKKQLDDERTARIEEAKARGGAMVTVNSGK